MGNVPRFGFRGLCATALALVICATGAASYAGDSSAPAGAHTKHATPWRRLPPYLLDPEALHIEHWPSNYVPNNYSLRAYRDPYAPPRLCRGRGGTTLSSAPGQCADGQQQADDANTLSTRGP